MFHGVYFNHNSQNSFSVHHNSRTHNNGQSQLHENKLTPPQGRDFVISLSKQPNAKVNRCHFQCLKNGLLLSQFFLPFLSIVTAFSAKNCSQFFLGGETVSPATPLGRPVLGLGDSCAFISHLLNKSMTIFHGPYFYKMMSIICSKLKWNQ